MPDKRQDYYLAQLAQIAFNTSERASKTLPLEDFLLFQNVLPPSPDEVDERLRLIFGGMVAAPKES